MFLIQKRRLISYILLILGIVATTILLLRVWGPSVADWQQYAYNFKQFGDEHYLASALIYMAIYTMIVVSGLPFFVPMTLMGGYLFGFVGGLLYVTIAANTGAIISFLLASRLLKHFLMQRYGKKLEKFKQHVVTYGANYLLMMQLLMIFPYVVINTLAALSGVSLWTFAWTTIVGSFPMILIHVVAGQQLHTMSSFGDIISPRIILVLLLVASCAMLPFFARRWMRRFKENG